MTTGEARRVAEVWVGREVARFPEVVAAVLAGSARARAAEAAHPAGSDVDIVFFVEAEVPSDIREPRGRYAPRKLVFQGVVLEPSFLDVRRTGDPEAVAGDMHLAPLLAEPCILFDPRGWLKPLAAAVAPEVRRRCHAQRRLAQALLAATPSEPYASVPEGPGLGAGCWRHAAHAFGVMRCAGAVLVAGQVYPTTRRSFVVARDLLRAVGREPVADELLRLLGSLALSRGEVEALAAEAERSYDLAVAVRRTPVVMDWNVSSDARALECAAVREMMAAGHHREAVYQLLLVRTVVQGILENDASADILASSRDGYNRLLTALGIGDDESLRARGREVRAFLPVLTGVCEAVLARAPALRD